MYLSLPDLLAPAAERSLDLLKSRNLPLRDSFTSDICLFIIIEKRQSQGAVWLSDLTGVELFPGRVDLN